MSSHDDKNREPSTLVDRLRGIYNIPVNDGAGLLEGKDTYMRQFGTTPIQSEAADRIEQLERKIAEAKASVDEWLQLYQHEQDRREASPSAIQRTPPGWKLVPVEPTKHMSERGEDAAVKQYDYSDWEDAKDMAEALDAAPIWNAMLAACPRIEDEFTPRDIASFSASPSSTAFVEDGFGQSWAKCERTNCRLEVVRPGKAQCDMPGCACAAPSATETFEIPFVDGESARDILTPEVLDKLEKNGMHGVSYLERVPVLLGLIAVARAAIAADSRNSEVQP